MNCADNITAAFTEQEISLINLSGSDMMRLLYFDSMIIPMLITGSVAEGSRPFWDYYQVESAVGLADSGPAVDHLALARRPL